MDQDLSKKKKKNKDSNKNNDSDSNKDNDNLTKPPNNHSSNSICLVVSIEYFHIIFKSV